jgi:hypothetical protein
MILNEYNDNKIVKTHSLNIVTNVFKHYKDSIFGAIF